MVTPTRLSTFLPACGIVVSLAACSGDGPTATGAAGKPPDSYRNALPVSGQGNSGGVLSQAGRDSASGVEATMRYNSEAGRPSGATVEFHNGALTGVGINCSRAGGGSVVPECDVHGAKSAYLLNELSGNYAYAGTFAIIGLDSGGDATVAIHSGPGETPGAGITLPTGSVGYTGRFQAGASLKEGRSLYAGRATGTARFDANFDDATLSAQFDGVLTDAHSGAETALTGGFQNATITEDGYFHNGADTTFDYAGSQAWGEVDGGFYGPEAQEIAGTYAFGNDKGGMTGIMLGCVDNSPANCMAPPPRN